jgi:hypothetical protein
MRNLTAFYRLCISNLSIILPISGAASAFLANLILKSHLDSTVYGEFASSLFMIVTLYMIAGLGYEQVLVRLTEVEGDKVVVRSNVAILGFSIIVISPIICHYILLVFGVIDESNPLIIASSFMISISNILSTLYKITGRLISHYLFLHAWKVVLLVLILVKYVIQGGADIVHLELVVLSLTIGFLISCLSSSFQFVVFRNAIMPMSKLLLYSSAGAISIIGFSIFDGLDRFLIKEVFDKAVFGDYFFIFSFIMSPVAIVSGYVSAKQLSFYKKSFRVKIFKQDYFKVLIISTSVAITFTILIQLLVFTGLVTLMEGYYEMLIIIFFISIIRGGYFILSMAYSILCSSQLLILIGVVFAGIGILMFYLMSIIEGVSVVSIGLLLFILWSMRSVIYWFLIMHESKYFKMSAV